MSTSRVEIDLGAIERNYARVARIVGPMPDRTIGGAGVCAVLKQDAYGMGVPRIAKRLAAAGAKMFAVYNLDEARTLFESVPEAPVLVLMPVAGVERSDPLYRAAAAGRLHLVLHDLDQLAGVTELAGRLGLHMPVHVQLDTGLSRGGERAEDAAKIVERVLASARVRLAGLMTHFAAPGDDPEFTGEQWRQFRAFADRVGPMLTPGTSAGLALHAANTCGAFRSRRFHGSMVRIGEALFGMVGGAVWGATGDGLAGMEFAAEAAAMEPAVRWTTTVSHVQDIPAGWPVGYGSTWRAPRRADGRATRIAMIPVGYADGYPRSLGGSVRGGPGMVGFTGRVWDRRSIHGTDTGSLSGGPKPLFAPIVGRVSMDQITVDVTELPENYIIPGRAGLRLAGTEVELVGMDPGAPNHLPALASAGGTIAHELLCRMGPRLDRVYRFTGVAHGAEAGTRAGAAGKAESMNAGAADAAQASVPALLL